MTVRELIAKLSEFDQDLPACVDVGEVGYAYADDVERVELTSPRDSDSKNHPQFVLIRW